MSVSNWRPEDHIPTEVKDMLQQPDVNYTLCLFNIIQHLKLQKRTGWVNNNVDNPESISDHMYRMGIMSLILATPNIDRDRCMKISLAHDIAESLVGDITPLDPMTKEEKHIRELRSIEYICNTLIRPYNEIAAKELLQYWLDYENQTCPEGEIVKDLDKFEMLVQCFEYERQHKGEKNLDQFWGCVKDIKSNEVKQWTKDLLKERERYFRNIKK